MTPEKDFKADLLAINDKHYVQASLSQFNLNDQGNKQAWDKVTETTTTVKLYLCGHQLQPYHFQVEK